MRDKDKARFWGKVDKSGGPDSCWLWTASKMSKNGYGHIMIDKRIRGAHRVAKAIDLGLNHPDDIKLQVLHTCDVKPCCNPQHLYLGTVADNMLDKAMKGRHNNCKLNPEKVIQIRRRYKAGGIGQVALSKEYNVCQATIERVVNRKYWKHVIDPLEASP